MSEFGTIERYFASVLAAFPGIKIRVKLLYQKFNHLIYKKPYSYYLKEGVIMDEFSSNQNQGNFWGYYDASPLFHGNFMTHSFDKEICLKNRLSSEIDILVNNKKISSTRAWNWQQGARLFWVNKNTILHNVFQQGQYKSKLVHLDNKTSELIDAPVYAYDMKSQAALGLNFKQLAVLDPAYGYFAHTKNQEPTLDDLNDGIFKIDITTNKKELIISLKRLKEFHKKSDMKNALHGINHIQISPDAKRFMFLHRWYLKNGQKKSRLLTADMDGSNLHILSDDGMVSHCNWKNNEEVIGWMHKKNMGNGYYLHKDQTDHFEQIGPGILLEDGHPSFSACGAYLLTDTYPDRSRMSHLLRYNLASKKLITLGSFYTPLSYNNENRCDLHPRFTDDQSITLDTVYDGLRKQVKLDISKLL